MFIGSKSGCVAILGLALILGATPSSAQLRAQGPLARREHHAGEWLRKYKDLPPDQQQKALDNDPDFRRLPPFRQQQLRFWLQRFSSLPPAQQQRILTRMEIWEHLTPEQKQQGRQLFAQLRELPILRRRMVLGAVTELRQLPPEQRKQVIDSKRYQQTYTPQERELLRGFAQLPLVPDEGGQNEQMPEQ